MELLFLEAQAELENQKQNLEVKIKELVITRKIQLIPRFRFSPGFLVIPSPSGQSNSFYRPL